MEDAIAADEIFTILNVRRRRPRREYIGAPRAGDHDLDV